MASFLVAIISLEVAVGVDRVAVFTGDVVEAPSYLTRYRHIGDLAAWVCLRNPAGACPEITCIRIPLGLFHPKGI